MALLRRPAVSWDWPLRDEVTSAEAQYRAALYFGSASWQNRKACRTAGAIRCLYLGLVRGRIPIWPAHVLDLAA
jgi:hypothetical protein